LPGAQRAPRCHSLLGQYGFYLERINLGSSHLVLGAHKALGLPLSSQEWVEEGFEGASLLGTRAVPFPAFL